MIIRGSHLFYIEPRIAYQNVNKKHLTIGIIYDTILLGGDNMSTQRTLVILEPPVRKMINEIAKKEHVSISSLCRDLIKEALEINEDKYFTEMAMQREKKYNWKKGLSHEEVWDKK